MSDIHAELLELLRLKREFDAELKRRAMIYQVDAKEWAAEWLGLPLNTFHNCPYPRWAVIRKAAHDEIDDMSANIRLVEAFHSLPANALAKPAFSDWHTQYLQWKESTGTQTPLQIAMSGA